MPTLGRPLYSAAMTRARLQRPFAHLALLAMLALALLPSAGRIAGALRAIASADDIALSAMCMPSGLGAASPALKRILPTDEGGRPAPSAPSPHDDDCAYCPLLVGFAPTLPAPAIALAPLPAIAPPALAAVAPLRERLPGAPGARGPPA